MPAASRAKPFKVKVHLALRYIMRYEDGEYQADCIDAAAIGLGETQQAALQDLITNLEETYQFASANNLEMLTVAEKEEEALYARLAARQSVDASVLGYGVIQRVEIVSSATPKKKASSSHFEIGQHTSLAA